MALRAYRDEIYQYAEKENKPEVVALYEKVDKFIYRCVGLVDKKREKKDMHKITKEKDDILIKFKKNLVLSLFLIIMIK